MNLSEHKKQFLLSPKTFQVDGLDGWAKLAVDGDYNLFTHPLLSVNMADREGIRLIGLGTFIDPQNTSHTETNILERLASTCGNFQTFEECISLLGGRWILVATIESKTRIYHDATGLKSIYYFAESPAKFFAGSHPRLFVALGITNRDDNMIRKFESHGHSGSWPACIVPYTGTYQTLPNHYLDLEQMTTRRYWPMAELQPTDTATAAADMMDLLERLIEAFVKRNSCVLNLTGGYDSRLLLAASKKLWSEISFFTLKGKGVAHHDISIPKQFTKQLAISHDFVDFEPVEDSKSVSNDLQQSVDGLWYDDAISTFRAEWEYVGDRSLLQGLVSEVTRCFYQSGMKSSHTYSPEEIARLAGFPGNPIAEEGFAIWLEKLPPNLFVDPLDLLYWEHRLGVWAATGMTIRDSAIDLLPPMNCRRFLEIGLSVDRKDRRSPHALIRQMIGVSAPELLELEFNHDWVDGLGSAVRKLPIFWRLEKYLR